MALVIKSCRIVLQDRIFSGCIEVQNGKISAIRESYDVPVNSNVKVIDAGNLVVMPGIVDSHVHINEPGRTQWEGFQTATQAAAAGGITTVVDMPLNSIPPTTTMEGFQQKLAAADKKCWVDVAFWGGVVPGNKAELKPLMKTGVCGFKCFLIHSGVDEFPHVEESDVCAALEEMKDTNSVLLFHAEVDVNDTFNSSVDSSEKNPQEYKTFLKSRPESMENQAIDMVIRLCEKYGVQCHIVHLSSASALGSIKKARAAGIPLTIETTHHYLTLNAEDIPDCATQFKCCPPIRNKDNQNALWEALKSGDIDLVVSDHSPCTPDLKVLDEGDFLRAWGGISSLQYGLSLFWTNARQRGFTLHDVTRVLCEQPAALCRINNQKGCIAVGMDADFVIWDPEAQFKVEKSENRHRNKLTPYEGSLLHGVVQSTILRGQVIYENGTVCNEKPLGEFLLFNRISSL